MGTIVTFFLITTNVYNSVDAPRDRGFSYIELWILGIEIPILIALLEYGFILYLMKKSPISTKKDQNQALNAKINKIDYVTMFLSLLFFVIFFLSYWTFALSNNQKDYC